MQECTLPYQKNNVQGTVPFEDGFIETAPPPVSPKPARRKSLQNRSAPAAPRAALPAASLTRWGEGWLLDCELRRHSPKTGGLRRMILKNLAWLAVREGWTDIGKEQVRVFLGYLSTGHLDAGGRWGNPQMTRPVRPVTVHTYHSHLKTFFSWLVVEGVLGASPMATIRPPVARADQVQPFTTTQVEALLSATGRSWHPARDAAIVWMLLDTGIRAAELCALTNADLDLPERRITVRHGKGDKGRTVYFGLHCGKALWRYHHSCQRRAEMAGEEKVEEEKPDGPLFPAENGTRRGEALSPRGLGQQIERLGERAELAGVRCSPHTFRHTFAVMYLRAGGQQFALKEILGHTSLSMTTKYVQFAEADLAGQRRFSPGDRIRGKTTQVGRPKNTPKPSARPKPPADKTISDDHAPRKLSPLQVREIRAALETAETRQQIADRYGVSVSMIKQIRSGAVWGDVE